MPTKTKPRQREDDVPDTTKAPGRFAVVRRGPSRYAGRRLELPLEGVRKAFEKTQSDVAKASGIDQPYVSRLENRDSFDDVSVGRLRRYVAALGGDLELVVACPNGARIVVRPSTEPAKLAKAAPSETRRKARRVRT